MAEPSSVQVTEIQVPRLVDPWWHTLIVTVGTVITTALKLAVTLVLGAILGVFSLYYLMITSPAAVLERWQWTDAAGEVWQCARLPGLQAQCEHRREGQLVFYTGELPQPSPCTIIHTQSR